MCPNPYQIQPREGPCVDADLSARCCRVCLCAIGFVRPIYPHCPDCLGVGPGLKRSYSISAEERSPNLAVWFGTMRLVYILLSRSELKFGYQHLVR
jgi:hypothetical protein